ncbi:Synaptopodin 2-like protein [Camelus dromedarius]|uniref:Synaptopodin 2-like protein n=1 Tax=Camelus dromedarius TaxID=9838 RepID=A0A5N4DHS9_CAMDR|nr:Synaptopodin 2-like protein [Camelus dromedarius]
MGAEEEVLVTLSGGAPWGFRLQGGAEQRKPLQVSKIRRRSQAGRAGLREKDQLLAINGVSCTSLSHASAMSLIDASGNQLVLTVHRVEDEGPVRSPSPGERQALSPLSPLSPEPPGAPVPQPLQPGSLLSPPDSEAYYGETDSDADGPATQEKPRRPRRRGPTRPTPPGAPPDEVYLSDSPAEPAPAVLGPPSQGDSRVSSPSWEDGTTIQPSPAEALLLPRGPLRPGPNLIPMVGPVPHPVAEDLTTTYAQKAKQAKLQRAESLQERSVKEAKTKCRTIASLLTAAPNPHSKGVLMFKKRRQRAKKYTLVSFGAAAGTGAEEEEDGVPPTSESELDEEAFSDARSLTNQPDWDSPYLDMELARPGSKAAEGQGPGLGGQLTEASGRGAQLFEQQRQRAASSTLELARDGPAAMLNGQGLHAREQRISVPAARTGILQEARRRGTRKQMFRPGNEETKNSPNPELLSLVQNLDEKPRAAGAESGPEEDALSLGAEACNFMQPPGGRSYKTLPHVTPKTPPPIAPKTPPPMTPKTPPPVAPKPPSRGFLDGLVNGAAPSAGIPEPPRLQGRGGELFAKRQSRADSEKHTDVITETSDKKLTIRQAAKGLN